MEKFDELKDILEKMAENKDIKKLSASKVITNTKKPSGSKTSAKIKSANVTKSIKNTKKIINVKSNKNTRKVSGSKSCAKIKSTNKIK